MEHSIRKGPSALNQLRFAGEIMFDNFHDQIRWDKYKKKQRKREDHHLRRSLGLGGISRKMWRKENERFMYDDEKLIKPDTPLKEIFPQDEVKEKLKTIDIITEHPNPTNPHALSNSQKIYKTLKIARTYQPRPPSSGLKEYYYFHPQNRYKHRFYPKNFN
ncbi:unnamed protein product [Moneuplotes crassus]|uniref:Uncharacterized protein n=1 Tax=Euplotes crassus TaxID=5936 RepID=A0AAD2D687_EUPCR|nr:unnamed protein product [Moneuplotes crassus]